MLPTRVRLVQADAGRTSTLTNLRRRIFDLESVECEATVYHSIDSDVRHHDDHHRDQINKDQNGDVVTNHVERTFFPFDAARNSGALNNQRRSIKFSLLLSRRRTS